jgi:hypothetical protein
MRWTLGAVAALLVGAAVWWAVANQNAWEGRCHDQGGTVETRFEGFITILIKGVPHLQPQYSYHCWVGGHEVRV